MTSPTEAGEHDGPPHGEALEAEADGEVYRSFDRAVEEGAGRLNRALGSMLAAGTMAGIDVGFGVLLFLFIEHQTGSELLAGLGFTIGFLALALGRSELFTENFLVPVTTVVAGKGSLWQLGRLWATTYATNLAGGWLIAALVVIAYPDLHQVAVDRGADIIDRGLGVESFMLAVLAGAAITLMTWMERNAETEGGRLLSVIAFGFLLGAAHLNHVVVISIKMFAGLQVGTTEYGYLDWWWLSLLAVAGNMLGGLTLVTLLRIAQVGPTHIRRRRRTPMRVRDEDGERHIDGEK